MNVQQRGRELISAAAPAHRKNSASRKIIVPLAGADSTQDVMRDGGSSRKPNLIISRDFPRLGARRPDWTQPAASRLTLLEKEVDSVRHRAPVKRFYIVPGPLCFSIFASASASVCVGRETRGVGGGFLFLFFRNYPILMESDFSPSLFLPGS